MIKLKLLAVLLLLSGCAEYQAMVAEYGAQAADDSLNAARWAHCQSPTAASLERKYQLYSNPNGLAAMAWRDLCYGNTDVVIEETAAGGSAPWGYTAMCRREPGHPLCPQ